MRGFSVIVVVCCGVICAAAATVAAGAAPTTVTPDELIATKRPLKILVKQIDLAYSHLQFTNRLADVLVAAGHTVDILFHEFTCNFVNATRNPRVRKFFVAPFRYDASQLQYEKMGGFLDTDKGMRSVHLSGLSSLGNRYTTEQTKNFFSEKKLIDALEAENYDAAIGERMDVGAFVLFHRIGARAKLGVMAGMLTARQKYAFGVPLFTSFAANVDTYALNGASPRLSFFARAANFLFEQYEFWLDEDVSELDAISRAAFGAEFPSLRDILRNISLLFENSNEFLTLPSPASHKIVHIGGIMHQNDAQTKPLEPVIQDIFDASKKGVVYFSLGTFLNTHKMSDALFQTFANAFAVFPDYEFVLKFDGSENQTRKFPPNVHPFGWLNQIAILAHPKLKLFITHAGQNSANELSEYGVPVLCIPFMFDQLHNAAMFEARGMGLTLDLKRMTTSALRDALAQLLGDATYARNAQKLAQKVRAAPFAPAEKFVAWTEFAARFGDLNELNLPRAEDVGGLFAYYNLDVVLALAVLGLALLAAAALAVAATLRLALMLLYGLADSFKSMPNTFKSQPNEKKLK